MNYSKRIRASRRAAKLARAFALTVFIFAALILALGATLLAAGGTVQGGAIILAAGALVALGMWDLREARNCDRAAAQLEAVEDEWRASWH